MPDQLRLPTRSVGLKFLLVCILAVLMALPATAIWGLVYDRTNRVGQAVNEVGQRFGGEQTFAGPILVAPYRVVEQPQPTAEVPRPLPVVRNGWYVVFAKTGEGLAVADTDERPLGNGGLFKVRTYEADVTLEGAFDLTGEPRAAPENATIDWTRAVLLVGVADPRGAAAPAALAVSGRGDIPLEPGSAYGNVFGDNRSLQWLVAPVGDLAAPGAKFTARTRLKFTGVESLSLVAFARDTNLRIRGDWDDIGYRGAFASPPDDTVEDGFDSRWTVPFIARNLADSGDAATLGHVAGLSVGVNFVDVSNPYQAVTRALKYALMFLGVVFLAYFLMEATSDRRVHPAQYILVGLAQLIFYLLLLSIAERIGFDIAFLIAAGATVTLIGAYAGSVFRSVRRGLLAFVAFATLYGLIYVLMKLEDYALLAGSVAAFVAIAAVMWFTRNLDWYGLVRPAEERAS